MLEFPQCFLRCKNYQDSLYACKKYEIIPKEVADGKALCEKYQEMQEKNEKKIMNYRVGERVELGSGKATELLNKESDDNILEFITETGTRFKYDVENNEFACVSPNGITQTNFKPTGNIKYWEGEVIGKYEQRKD